MSCLWSQREAVQATGGECNKPWQATGVSIDSRTIEPGDLFVAIEGPNLDGHNYVASAFERGAAAAMVRHIPKDAPADKAYLVVGDTLAGLQDLGKFARARSRARIAAITGSVGKTSTKEALLALLGAQGKTHASIGSFNNQWGVPLSLARMPVDTEYGIFEIGMNHAGEISPLSAMVCPHVALITTVEAAHLEFFDDISDIARAKAEIFDGLAQDGSAVLNRDNDQFALLAELAAQKGVARVVSFGSDAGADARLQKFTTLPNSSAISAILDGHSLSYEIGIPGAHWIVNSLGILLVIKELGANVDAAAAAMKNLNASKGRGQRHDLMVSGKRILVIDDSYNASPTSMRAGIAALDICEIPDGARRIAVLGDMLELGSESALLHAALGRDISASKVDMVFACGPEMAHLFNALPSAKRAQHTLKSEQLVAPLMAAIKEGDVVYIKGSLGSRMSVVLEALMASGQDYSQAVGV